MKHVKFPDYILRKKKTVHKKSDLLLLQRQRRVHKDRLMNEFTAALSNFQTAQRLEKEKEKESVDRSRHRTGFIVSLCSLLSANLISIFKQSKRMGCVIIFSLLLLPGIFSYLQQKCLQEILMVPKCSTFYVYIIERSKDLHRVICFPNIEIKNKWIIGILLCKIRLQEWLNDLVV